MKVFFVFPGPGGDRQVVSLEFSRGKRLRDYLRSSELRRFGLTGRATRMRVMDQDRRKLRLHEPLTEGTTIHFTRPLARQ